MKRWLSEAIQLSSSLKPTFIILLKSQLQYLIITEVQIRFTILTKLMYILKDMVLKIFVNNSVAYVISIRSIKLILLLKLSVDMSKIFLSQ